MKEYILLSIFLFLVIIGGIYTGCSYYYNKKPFSLIVTNKIIFYLLQFSWGLFMNLLGIIAFLFFLCIGKRPQTFGYCFVIPLNGNSGLSLGIFIFANTKYLSMLCHEHGHSFQNAVFGPFMIVLVGIPSVIRFWYREAIYKWGNYQKLPDYDAIWFEGMATESGIKFIKENKV